MKKITFIILIIILFTSIQQNHVYADIIMEGYKPVNFCAKIENSNQYGLTIVSNQYDVMPNTEILNDNLCLTAYKFSNVNLYWNKSGNLTINDNKKLISDIKHYYGDVEKENPLKSITELYRIYKIGQNKYGIYLSKRIKSFDNGNKNKIEVFNQPKKNIEPYIDKKIINTNTDTNIKQTNGEIEKQTKKDKSKVKNINLTNHMGKSLWERIINYFNNLFR